VNHSPTVGLEVLVLVELEEFLWGHDKPSRHGISERRLVESSQCHSQDVPVLPIDEAGDGDISSSNQNTLDIP